jgi:hypothetical protein
MVWNSSMFKDILFHPESSMFKDILLKYIPSIHLSMAYFEIWKIHFVFHWKTLNHHFGICASNKSLSHASQEINDGRDFIS